MLSLVLLLLASGIVDGASQCRKNWQQYSTSCYYLNSDTLTWDNAQAYCETLGGHLASIADSGVNSHVAGVMSGYSKAHIGITDTYTEGSWAWWDGSSLSYTNWNSGEPNGGYGSNCGGMYSSGTWDDYPCTTTMVSVCRAPIQYTATKTGCACPFDTGRTDCACCVTGGTHCGQVYPNECYYSSTSECGTDANNPIDDWQLVMKVTRSSSINVYDLYTGSSTYNDGSTTANILTSTSVSYKSSEANSYDTSSLEQIKFAFYSSGVEVRSLTFDTSGTSRTSWYHTNYMSYAPYSDIYTDTKNFQSMVGSGSGGNRRFFMNRHYSGCGGDAGWFVVIDYGSNSGCSWDGYYSTPFFIYSAASSYQYWDSGSRGFPDTVAFLHKYYDDGNDDLSICESGWSRNRNGCYKVVESTTNYRAAMKACRALHDGADLVSVADQTENDYLLTLSRRTFATTNYWIGFTDLDEEGTWTWTDGSVASYTKWHSGEPSGGSEHCGVIRWSTDGSWNDATCWSNYGYICKYPLNKVSCADWKRKGYTSSGYYTIDPDGRNTGVDPFRVYCDMTTDASTGIMTLSHQEEYRSLITGYEGARSGVRSIRYGDRSIDQVAMAADISSSCSQYIKYECHGSYMTGYTAWYDRDGNQKNYWGGATVDSGQCACGNSGTCTNGHHCNCNTNDNNWREDSGYLTDKSTLPVTEIRFGDTGDASESGYYTLEPLYCKGDESYIVTDRTDFMLIRDRHLSGYNNDYQSGLTVNQCAAACVAASSFVCRSFDFHPSDGGCYLSVENDQTVALSSGSDYHLHVRIMDAMVDPYEEPSSCSSGWQERDSHCYRTFHGGYTWLNAEIYCQEQGGHLVTPSDLAEYNYVRRIFRWAQRSATHFWIGLNDIEEEGTWVDAEGNNVVYTNWKSGEPNRGISENGVIMYSHSTDGYTDATVQTGRNFVCKEALGATAIAQPTTHPLCDSDWAWDDHSCYSFVTSSTKTWSDAQDYCHELGGDLVTVETDREFNFLVNYYRYRYSSRRFWIGLTYRSDGSYRWKTEISVYPSDGSHWESGKPDGAASGQNCVEFATSQSYNDEACSTALYYICEKDTIPTSYPATFELRVTGPSAIYLSWSALTHAEQNSDVTGYYIHYWPINKQNTKNVTIDVLGLDTYFYHLTGIAGGTTFEFIIQAHTDHGVGLETDPPINGTTEVAFVRNSDSQKANFVLRKGYRLRNHALYELEAYTMSECTNHCLRDDNCVSVNYHKLSRAPRKTCVLNQATHATNAADLVADRDYMYGCIDGI